MFPLPEGGRDILFQVCPSVRPSFRPSKIYFVAFFSVTVDCMLNVYKNQQNRQTGSRNLMGPKTYMKLVTKYQISAINSGWEKCDEKWAYMFNTCICTFFVTFFSATIDGRDLIFDHKLHIGTPYRGKRFWIHQIPTSCLPTLLIFIHIEHTF
jgi:hypothetical protein